MIEWIGKYELQKCDPRRALERHSCPKCTLKQKWVEAMATRGESGAMGMYWEHLGSQVSEPWPGFELEDLKPWDVEQSHFPRRKVMGSDSGLSKGDFRKNTQNHKKWKKKPQ